MKFSLIILLPIAIFLISEFKNPTSRLDHLIFIKNNGFVLQIEELRKEHNARLIHNKLTQSISTLSNQYFSYFSHDFLVAKGDANVRFGFPGISPISSVEYVFLFVGLYFLFKNKEKYRYLIVSLLLTSPITAALSWQTQSITRSYILIIPIMAISSYGFFQSISIFPTKIRTLYVILIFLLLCFSTSISWDFYFNHYIKKKDVVSAWQCGYKELSNLISQKYNNYDRFEITNKLGQPYIFLVYNLKYSPDKYQNQARLSRVNEYGFGQIDRFDKFYFSFSKPTNNQKTLHIGLPEDFVNTGLYEDDVDKITIYGYDVFWIYPKK